MAGGTDIEIVLDVRDASESVSGEDKAKVEAALSGYTTGQYLDISLYKLIGESRTSISETSEKITITIAIPDSLKNKDSATTRAFAFIRVHEGVAEILEDLDNSAVNPAPVRDNEPVTGDSTPIELYATLAVIAGLFYLLLYFREHRRGMTEEEKKE